MHRLPGLATWKRYDILARRLMLETPAGELEHAITAMLRKAHEKGAAAMQDRAVLAVRRMQERQFHSRATLALACVQAIRQLPCESGRPPVSWTINHHERQFLPRQPKRKAKPMEVSHGS